MIYKKSRFRLLTLLLALSLVAPQFSYAKSCEGLFETKKVFFTPERKKKYLRLAITIPLSTAIGIIAWQKIDEHFFWPKVESQMTLQALEVTENHRKMYDDLIAYDFRFKKINSTPVDAEAVKINPKLSSPDVQKRVLAFNLQQSYLNYYQKYHEIKHPSQLTLEQNTEKFGEHPLFKHLNFFFANGVQKYPGATVDDKNIGALTDKQKNTLFMLTHELYAKYALIDLAFNQRNQRVLENSEEIKSILSDPYTQKLLELEKDQKINRTELVYFLQEDAYHAYYFLIFESLHIHEQTQLSDLRAERLSTFQ